MNQYLKKKNCINIECAPIQVLNNVIELEWLNDEVNGRKSIYK